MSTQPAFATPHAPLPNSDLLTWLGIDNETFISGLEQRTPGVTRKACVSVAEDLRRIHPVLRLAFKHWWETGEMADLGSFSGYTVNDLLTGAKGTIRFRPTGVFLMLDTLITDPEKAIEQLARPVHGFIPPSSTERIMPARRNSAH
jgi:hypothetical protein